MSLLSQLLQRALIKRPSQVIIETDRPLVVITDRGAREQGTELPGEALFEALFAVMNEEQQAELVVGKRVEFDLDAGGRAWTLQTETAADRIAVRARLRPQLVAEVSGAPTRPPELRDDDDDLVLIIDGDELEAPRRVPGVAYLTGDGVSVEEIEVELDEPDELVALHVEGVAGSRDGSVVAFKREPSGPRSADVEVGGARRLARSRVERDRLLSALTPGTLCFLLRGLRGARPFLTTLGLPVLWLGEDDTPREMSERVLEVEDDAIIVVTVDDPSPWLPWILRRLEEGRRVLIETGARTPAGARRVLLGVTATPRAEGWLACMRVASVTRHQSGWSVVVDEA